MDMQINDEHITYARGVPGVVGDDRVLLSGDDNLIAGNAWEDDGYTVEAFLDDQDWTTLRAGIIERLRDLLRETGISTPADFDPEQYHRYIAGRDHLHLQIAKQVTRGFPIESLPIAHELVVNRISEICGVPLRIKYGEEMPRQDVFCLRVVRPRSNDNNPLHRDSWIDHLRNAVNIYGPIAGSNARSSLPMVPGSHRWKESEIERTEGGALINDVHYSVPSLVGSVRPVHAVRPDPAQNRVLVFSPYVIHGGASNLNEDVTRISLEMRFWRRES